MWGDNDICRTPCELGNSRYFTVSTLDPAKFLSMKEMFAISFGLGAPWNTKLWESLHRYTRLFTSKHSCYRNLSWKYYFLSCSCKKNPRKCPSLNDNASPKSLLMGFFEHFRRNMSNFSYKLQSSLQILLNHTDHVYKVTCSIFRGEEICRMTFNDSTQEF